MELNTSRKEKSKAFVKKLWGSCKKAMPVSKRKFDTLLNNLGSRSSVNIPLMSTNSSLLDLTSEDDADSNSKKRRLSRTNSMTTLSSHLRPVPTSSSPCSTILTKPNSMVSPIPVTSEEAPAYAPWDQEAFLKRLKTFSNITDWTPKPKNVNEVEWAKRGWVCGRFERLRCVSCNTELVCKLNKKTVDGEEQHVTIASSIEQSLADKYAEMIITSHAEDCLWRQRGCSDDILKLRLNNPAKTLKALRERYDSLFLLADKLPYEHNLQPPKEFELDVVLRFLPRGFFASQNVGMDDTNVAEVNRVAIQMALFGYEARLPVSAAGGIAQCGLCFRTLGLWLYKSKDVNENGEMVAAPTIPFLNGNMEHREYCPWRSHETPESTESPPAELAGWQVLIQVLQNDHFLRQRAESTTSRPSPLLTLYHGELEDGDTSTLREADDKKRWARIRRVKSAIFNTRPLKKMQKEK